MYDQLLLSSQISFDSIFCVYLNLNLYDQVVFLWYFFLVDFNVKDVYGEDELLKNEKIK